MKRMLFDSRDLGYWHADLGIFVARAFAGVALALGHGWGKIFHAGPLGPTDVFIQGVANLGFPMPELFAWAAALAELVGGLLMAIGLLTRPAALAVAFNMGVAAFLVHAADPIWGATPSKELALLYLSIALMALFAGPGRISIDRLIAGDPSTLVRKRN